MQGLLMNNYVERSKLPTCNCGLETPDYSVEPFHKRSYSEEFQYYAYLWRSGSTFNFFASCFSLQTAVFRMLALHSLSSQNYLLLRVVVATCLDY